MSKLLDGVDDGYDSTTISIPSAYPFTVAMFVYQTQSAATIPATQIPWILSDDVSNFHYLYFDATTNYASFSRANTTFTTGPATEPALNGWSHILATVNESSCTVYLNGNPGTEDTTTQAFGAAIATEAVGVIFANNEFFGRVQDLAVWNRILTAAEIASIVGQISPLFFPKGLKRYTKFFSGAPFDVVAGGVWTERGNPSDAANLPVVQPGGRLYHPGLTLTLTGRIMSSLAGRGGLAGQGGLAGHGGGLAG